VGRRPERRFIVQVFETVVLNNTVRSWLVSLVVVIVATLTLRFVAKILVRIFSALEKRLPNEIARILCETFSRTKTGILFVVSVYVGSAFVSLPSPLEAGLRYLAFGLAGVQVGIWASFLTTSLVLDYMMRKAHREEVASSVGVISVIVRIVVWAIVVLVVLDNLEFNITTLVAGLGVGGIAVAMAAQNILADLFASLSIILDKPFQVGDFIVVGDLPGEVEHIGLKTTRVRSLSGEQLIFSNGDLLSSRIRNYRRMAERRILFILGVEYSTPYEKVQKIPAMTKEIIESISGTRFDRCHFSRYGDFSLQFETVYYVLSPDFSKYMDIQQDINLRLYRQFEKEGIAFAFPTQTLHLKQNHLAAIRSG
jgi:small-conductance mechanosensitive channel